MQKKHYLCSQICARAPVTLNIIMTLVFASNNAHKLSEVRQIMPNVRILSLADIGFLSEIEETGNTLDENSAIKAQTVWDWLAAQAGSNDKNMEINGVFADDTGLEIDVLNGAPGVYTARWYRMDDEPSVTGEKEVFGANRTKALRVLAGETNRGAQFRTVITLITQEGTIQVQGVVRGKISEHEYGNGGFGYDPVFVPEGYDQTFAELPIETKNSISHRARALAALVEKIEA